MEPHTNMQNVRYGNGADAMDLTRVSPAGILYRSTSYAKCADNIHNSLLSDGYVHPAIYNFSPPYIPRIRNNFLRKDLPPRLQRPSGLTCLNMTGATKFKGNTNASKTFQKRFKSILETF